MKIIELFEDEMKGLSDDEVVVMIQRDCKPFLNSDAEGLMYRGMRSKPSHAFKQSVRTDRKPKNMKEEVHQAIDAWFKKKFGFKARSEAVFVTGDHRDARSYGKAYAIFPIGDFEFVWSPDVGDLFIMFHNVKPEEVESELDLYNYRNDKLKFAIDSHYEIMVKCNEYYAVPIQEWSEGRALFDRLKGK